MCNGRHVVVQFPANESKHLFEAGPGRRSVGCRFPLPNNGEPTSRVPVYRVSLLVHVP